MPKEEIKIGTNNDSNESGNSFINCDGYLNLCDSNKDKIAIIIIGKLVKNAIIILLIMSKDLLKLYPL